MNTGLRQQPPLPPSPTPQNATPHHPQPNQNVRNENIPEMQNKNKESKISTQVHGT